MPQNTDLTIDIGLNLEGDWPRSAYLRHCQQHGIDYTEAGYLQWRTVGERLSGHASFETNVKRASEALARLGMSMAQAGGTLAAAMRRAADEEDRRVRACQQRAADSGAAGPRPQQAVLRG